MEMFMVQGNTEPSDAVFAGRLFGGEAATGVPIRFPGGGFPAGLGGVGFAVGGFNAGLGGGGFAAV